MAWLINNPQRFCFIKHSYSRGNFVNYRLGSGVLLGISAFAVLTSTWLEVGNKSSKRLNHNFSSKSSLDISGDNFGVSW